MIFGKVFREEVISEEQIMLQIFLHIVAIISHAKTISKSSVLAGDDFP